MRKAATEAQGEPGDSRFMTSEDSISQGREDSTAVRVMNRSSTMRTEN